MQIKLGLIKIECMNINLVNSSYSSGQSLHKYSKCCNSPVGYKNYCKNCDKTLTNEEILKGVDKNTILTDFQQEKLKQMFENSVITILSINKLEEDTLLNLMPYIQKSQILFPSLRKGWKKSDIQIYYAFKNSLEKINSYCVVKLVSRSKEHLGIIINYKSDLMYFEMPFNRQYNNNEINRLKEAVNREIKNIDINAFTKDAKDFINNFKGKEDLQTAKEEKLQLLKKYIEEIESGVETPKLKEIEVNPFK